MPRTWSKPTLPKATLEDADDPVLGWTAQHDKGPTHVQPYAPWKPGYKFVRPEDIVNPTTAATTATATTGGTLPAATYTYQYTWYTAKGETLPSAVSSGQVTTGSTSTVTLTLPAKPAWADGARIYGRSGTRKRIGVTATTTFIDTGVAIPAEALAVPTVSSAAKNVTS